MKLKLDLDDLKVESFETTSENADGQGTVQGYITQDLTICDGCQPTGNTCNNTCNNTCGNTCGNTCNNTCGNTCGSTCGSTCGNTCDSNCDGLTCLSICNTDFACFVCSRYC